MRPLNSQFAHDALPTLDALMKHSKEVRVFRRAQATHADQAVDPSDHLFF